MKKSILFLFFAVLFGCKKQSELISNRVSDDSTKEISLLINERKLGEARTFLEREIRDSVLFRMLDFQNPKYYYGNSDEIRIISLPIIGNRDGKYAFVYFSENGLFGNWVSFKKNRSNIIEGYLSESFDQTIRKVLGKYTFDSVGMSQGGILPLSTSVSLVPYRIETTIAGTLAQYITSPWSSLGTQINLGGDSYSSQIEFILPPEEGGGGGGTTINDVIEIEFDESEYLAEEEISKIFNCFDLISDIGATYSVTMCTDVPINSNPTALTDYTGSPGHTFLIVTKSNGNSSITKSFGFYPEEGKKSIALEPVASKLVNDKDHEINGSIVRFLDKNQFDILRNKAIFLATKQYDLNEYNCTDYALDVFNSTQVGNEITVEPVVIRIQGPNLQPIVTAIKSSPQTLYKKMQEIKQSYTPPATGGIYLSNDRQYRSPLTSGGCN